MVEKLLKFLITEIDTNLFKSVELKYLESSNIEHTDEVDFLHGGINKGSVTDVDEPREQPVVEGPGQGGAGVEALVGVLPLVHPLGTDLDLGSDEVAVEELPILDEVERADCLAGNRVVHLAALFASLLLEGHFPKMGNRGSQLEGVRLFLCAEAEGVESNICELQFLGVINGIYLHLPLTEEEVVIGVS
jgi:hypothetical protein